jgi:cytoskeletal protein RodZ
MVSGFSTKKLKSDKTLALVFRHARTKKKVSLGEAEFATKVRLKFLLALERGDWSVLPQDVYVRGFVLAYAKYLELPAHETLELFEKEAKIRRKCLVAKISYNQTLKEKKALITPKILAYFGLCVFVVALFSYVIYQILSFTGNPNLKIITPENNLITESDTIDFSGMTDTDAAIAVNNESVPVSDDGRFVLSLKLHRGVNVIKVEAVNKAKKESSEVYTIEYKPKAALNNSTMVEQ